VGTAAALSREPLLTWKSTQQKAGYPTDYKVPNFGVDSDILTTS